MASEKRSQISKFREAARATGANGDEAEFNRILGKVAKAKPVSKDELAKVTKGLAKRIGNIPPDDPKKPRR